MSIARNTLVTTVGTVATVAATLITVPLYISAIGLERYGVLAVVWTILAYAGLADLGVSGAMVQRLASGVLSASQRVVFYWTGFTLNALMGLVGGVALLFFFDAIMSMMSFTTVDVAREVQSTGWLVALLMVTMTLRPINNCVLYAAERFTSATVLLASEAVASTIVPLAVAKWFSVDIFWLIVSILVVRVFFLVASFVAMIPSLPGFRLVSGRLGVARDLLSTGFWFLLAGIFGPLLTYFDRLLIGAMVGVGRLPFYTIPQMILQQSSHVPRALGSVLFPRFSAIRDEGEASRLAVTAMQAMAFVVGPICVLLILAMDPILHAWLSGDFARHSGMVAIVLMSSLLPSAMARIVSSQLNGRNRPDLVVKILLLEIVPYGCAVYLATREYGLLGVAFVWTLRASVDALLLGAAGKVLLPMLKACAFPVVLIACALIVQGSWDMGEPQRWIASSGLCVATLTWGICFMPQSLACRFAQVRVLRWIPVGRFHRAGMH